MAVNCSPESLITNASTFCCITGSTAQAVKLHLLRSIAGLEAMTPQELLAASACFLSCVPDGAFKAIEAYLLCQIANGGSGPGGGVTFAATSFDGSGIFIDTDNQDTSVSFPFLTTLPFGDVVIRNSSSIASLTAPNLATIVNGVLIFWANTALTSISFPMLTTCPSGVYGYLCTSLTSVSLPLLSVPVLGDVDVHGCTLLSAINFASLVPNNGITVNFSGCALVVAGVDQILARCVANAGYVSGTVDLSGGTNATPSAAGLADKATLIGRGCTVNTN